VTSQRPVRRLPTGSGLNWANLVLEVAMTVAAVGQLTDGSRGQGWSTLAMVACLAQTTLANRAVRALILVCGLAIALVGVYTALGFGWDRVWAWAIVAAVIGCFGDLRRPSRESFGTEALVGKTVAAAMRRIGYDDGRAPHGLARPVLVPLPEAAVDLTDPELRIVAVVTDALTIAATPSRIWFGVRSADSGRPPILIRRESPARLRAELGERTGGVGPGVLRPLRFAPRSASRYPE
jgi:hypothetical protein